MTPLQPADLRVTSIVTQSSNDSGAPTTVQWTVTNVGNPAWSGTQYWVDDVYFSAFPTLDTTRDPLVGEVAHSNAQPLGAAQGYTQSLTFTLLQGIGGTAADPQDYYVYVITDPGGTTQRGYPSNDGSREWYTIHGYDAETDNQGSQTIPVVYREPDLRVTNLVVPTAPVQSGEVIPVSWTVTNVGNRETREGDWIDRVYLSPSPSLDDQATYLIGELPHSSSRKVTPSTILGAGDSYTATLDVRIPDGIQGTYDILVFTDSNETSSTPAPDTAGLAGDGSGAFGRVAEFQGEGNNITASPLQVILTPLPDLRVTSVIAAGPDPNQPGHVQTGQGYTVTYTVTDAGPGDTPAPESSWVDWIFLSRDPTLDSGDTYLMQENHGGGLKAGQSYQRTVTFQAKPNLTGPWYVIVFTDAPTANQPDGAVLEGNNEDNNTTATATPLVFDVPPPSDLAVSSIAIPGAAQSGQPVQITWTVRNVSPNPASGSWTDTVYLATDATWDVSDPLVGEVAFSGTVAPGGTYTSTLKANLPAAAAGQYRIIVRTNIFDDVVESNYLNNTTASADVVTVTVPALHLGVPLQTTLSTGQDQLYEVQVGLGQTLRVDLTSSIAGASNELYLRYERRAQRHAIRRHLPGCPPGQPVRGHPLDPGRRIPGPGPRPVGAGPRHGRHARRQRPPVRDHRCRARRGGRRQVRHDHDPGLRSSTPRRSSSWSGRASASIEPVSPPGGQQHQDHRDLRPDGCAPRALRRRGDQPRRRRPHSHRIATWSKVPCRPISRSAWAALASFRPASRASMASPSGARPTSTSPTSISRSASPSWMGPGSPYPHLAMTTNLVAGTNPDVADVPWASLDPVVDSDGEDLATAYAMDFADRSSLGESLLVQTYPDGIPPTAADNPPSDTAFQFAIMAAATTLTTAEFIAQQTGYAATLRAAILEDPTASPSLQVIAADPTSWTDLYLAALDAGGRAPTGG